MAESKPLVLVDGSSYLFRAYHALPPLATSKGQPTGAAKGVISMIRSLIKSYPESCVAVIFDAKGKTFRNDLFEQYKATRPPMPDDLRSQIEPIHRIIKAMGLPLLVVEGVEADDVIGTLAKQAWEKGMPTLVSTGDKDMAQLVNGHVTLLNTMTNERLDEEGVKRKFGLPPRCIVDFLALCGDKIDNIPGVPGVGPKTAVKWLEEYGSVENLIANAGMVPGKAGERLRECIDQLKLSRELATIKCDVPLEFGPDELSHGEPDKEELLALYHELEFRPWIRELEEEGVETPAGREPQFTTGSAGAGGEEASEDEAKLNPARAEYRTITTLEELKALARALREAGTFAFSLESDGEQYKLARIIGLSFSTVPGEGAYVPLGHDYMGVPAQLTAEQACEVLHPLFEDNALFKAGHDLKMSAHILLNYGVKLRGGRFDVMLQSYVLNSVAHRHSLDRLTQQHLGRDAKTLEELLGKGRNKLSYSQLPLEDASRWSAQNADFCLRLSRVLDRQLKETGRLFDVYRYFEIALVPVLTQMEENGIKVDVRELGEQSRHLSARLDMLEKEAYALAGEEFNLGSPLQLQKIFYEKLGYPVVKKTATGQPSTAEPILQELALHYPLPRVILEQRALSKLKSTYTDKLPQQINARTGRIHSCFQQAVAATGRLSSTDPNLQNIPIRSEEGRRIRKAFVAAPGYLIVSADYSQVELRIMAHLADDPGLKDAFSKGLDVHRATAAEIFGLAYEAVTDDMRRRAKGINFGLIYGMSAFGLSQYIESTRADAESYMQRYFERYPGVRRFMEETRAQAAEQGYVETVFGRRLYLPEIRASNQVMRKAAERVAINAPMQGTAADIIKQAMIDIQHWLDSAGLDARMVLQVHDELVFEVAERDVELLAQGVRFRMVSAASLKVPLVVDVGAGPNWGDAH